MSCPGGVVYLREHGVGEACSCEIWVFCDPFVMLNDFTADTVQLCWRTVGKDVRDVEGVGFCECSHSNTECCCVLRLFDTAFVPGGGVLVVFVDTVRGVSENIKQNMLVCFTSAAVETVEWADNFFGERFGMELCE